ncbi:MAG: hypothetical protein NXI30_15920 [bacterium]|nr:hypothetical protein [bacterium]
MTLLFCATAQATAQEGHKQAQQVPSEQIPVEERNALPSAIPRVEEESAHDHGNHGLDENSLSDSARDDATDHNVPKPLRWLGKFHPPVTHFPIALLTAAALAELLFLRTGSPAYRHALHFCVRIGAAAAVLAALLGWFFAGFRLVDEEWVMTAHRWAGTSVALFSLGLLLLTERLKGDATATAEFRFRAVLFTAAGLVGATGFLGGALLYGLDHYAW